jgi:signal transduction histidine kinase
MKRKIILSISIFSIVFVLSGIYIITTTEKAISKLNNLVTLHQVEILREHLLIQIKRVQTNLTLKGTRHARNIDTIVFNVLNLESVAGACFRCHHHPDVAIRLNSLKNGVERYKEAISRVFTIRADKRRLIVEEDSAFRIGEELIANVNNMINVSSLKLDRKTASVVRDITDTKFILYILVATIPFLAVILGFIIIKNFTRPINVLLDATKRLEGGDLSYRIEGLTDEFGSVASSFNRMSNSLKEQMNVLQRAEQMVVLGELAAGLAHEIKNPLAGIKVSVEVLTEEETISKEDREVLLKAVDEIKRIEVLIKSLLNFAKPPKPEMMRVEVNDVLDKTVAFSLRHPSLKPGGIKSISVVKDYDRNLPEIMADPLQLQQVFLNLLLNAIDAMHDGGTLGVKTFLLPDKQSVVIEISDTGEGIPEDMKSRIFQPFITTKSRGTGLGLAITSRLIDQHGGDLGVDNNRDGGATFRINLPVTREVEAESS